MFKVFRSSLFLFWVLLISGMVFLSLFSYGQMKINGIEVIPSVIKEQVQIVLSIILIFIWILVSMIIAEKNANKKVKKITDILFNECNPERAIIVINKTISAKNPGQYRDYFLLLLSIAHLYIGNISKARETLDKIYNPDQIDSAGNSKMYIHKSLVTDKTPLNTDSFPNTKVGSDNRVFYYSIRIDYFLQTDDLGSATKALNLMKNALNNKFIKANNDPYYFFYIENQYKINIANGDFDGAEMFFSILFDKKSSNIGKVLTKFQLGKIYLHYNKLDDAIAAFRYVIENGKNIIQVKEATQYLQQLP